MRYYDRSALSHDLLLALGGWAICYYTALCTTHFMHFQERLQLLHAGINTNPSDDGRFG
jgi:hypothetical protein